MARLNDYRKRRLFSRRSAGAVALATVVLIGASLTGADASPFHASAPAGVLPPPPPGFVTNEATLADGENLVTKAKVTIVLPRVLLLARVTVKFVPDPTEPPFGDLITDADAFSVVSPQLTVANPGPNPVYGVLQPQVVKVLGFGSIPVQATLNLTQPVDKNNVIQGLHIHVQNHTDAAGQQHISLTTVTGPLSLRISNVIVDQVPLDVGSNCHTVTPLQVNLIGDPYGNPPYDLFRGGPLTEEASFPPTAAKPGLTIPAFSGCRNGTEDLDPLLTGLVSGPHNSLSLQQGQLSNFDTSLPGDCGNCVPPTQVKPPPTK